MPADPTVTLPPGIGNDQQAQQATWFIRNQPWYQQWLKQNNIPLQTDAYGDVKLSDAQQQALLDVARQHGIGISDSYHVNENGQIAQNDSHWLRNLAIAGAIGGSLFIPGVSEAIMSGLESAGSALGLGGADAGAAEGAAGAAEAGGEAAGEGLLASTPIDAGLFTAPTVASSGAVDAALAGGAGAAGGGAAAGGGVASAAGSAASKLPDWLKTAQDLGGALGAASAGRAAGRGADNTANIQYANAQNNLYNNQLTAPQKIASNAVRGDILSNAQDVALAAPSDIPVPKISGGLRPSMFSDTTRQLGKNITSAAANTPIPSPAPPVLNPMETAGTTDSILNTAGYLSNLAKPGYDIWKMFNA